MMTSPNSLRHLYMTSQVSKTRRNASVDKNKRKKINKKGVPCVAASLAALYLTVDGKELVFQLFTLGAILTISVAIKAVGSWSNVAPVQ